MSNWIPIASVQQCPAGQARELVAGDRIIALFNVAGEFHALDGICPHQGGPLGKGALTGCVVTCPWHGWQFNVRTARHQASESLRLAKLPVRVEGDSVLVDVDA